eukprot:scaffold1084_cov114-Isochrysis_galbana.AAC.2
MHAPQPEASAQGSRCLAVNCSCSCSSGAPTRRYTETASLTKKLQISCYHSDVEKATCHVHGSRLVDAYHYYYYTGSAKYRSG